MQAKYIGEMNCKNTNCKKCRGKLDCLIHEMLYIKQLKPSLNKQSDSVN